ncbi:MAG: amidohydrolase, partial [Cellulomonadaceae bacterium]|nr:amidohydrolase [Cellulomonadaceae bacterium]
VVVWSGDPLEVASTVEHVLVAGVPVLTTDPTGTRRVVERRERFA